MAESPADPEPPPTTPSDDDPERGPESPPEPSTSPSSESAAEFGSQRPTRFAADVEYRGRVAGHDYLVRVRHRFLDSSFTVVIDGVEHDPKAEEKAAKKAEKSKEAEDGGEAGRAGKAGVEAASGTDPGDLDPGDGDRGEADPAEPDQDDGLRFRLEENFTVTYCTVRRPGEDGTLRDAEVLAVRTGGLGGAGEVDVRHGLERWPLAPADGSPSAVRDAKRLAHPTRYAALAALTKTLGFLLPLLGLGALFAGLLDPVTEWIARRIRPLIEWVGRLVAPIREWFAQLLRPVREFLDELLAPVREFVAALLRPLAEAWTWFWEMLRSWLPRFDLSGVIPEWVVDVAVPVIVVLAVFALTLRELRRRRERLEVVRAATAEPTSAQSPAAAELTGTAEGDGPAAADGAAAADEPAEDEPAEDDGAAEDDGGAEDDDAAIDDDAVEEGEAAEGDDEDCLPGSSPHPSSPP
ncbi:hypothetical protein [Brachybacterium sp. UNK5269]|uniref:hypothetical protein n=1 Tax=Brachybacterium sp. UNK5269 TaxID=3408576 RepID=UPI003BB20A15